MTNPALIRALHKTASVIIFFAILLAGTNFLQLVSFSGGVTAIEQSNLAKEAEDVKEEESVTEAEVLQSSFPRVLLTKSAKDSPASAKVIERKFLSRQSFLLPDSKSRLTYLCVFRL